MYHGAVLFVSGQYLPPDNGEGVEVQARKVWLFPPVQLHPGFCLVCVLRDGGTAHHATFSTAGTYQILGSANAGNDTSKSTGCSGRQNAATRRNMRREDRVTVQGPVKKQQPDGMSHTGGGGV